MSLVDSIDCLLVSASRIPFLPDTIAAVRSCICKSNLGERFQVWRDLADLHFLAIIANMDVSVKVKKVRKVSDIVKRANDVEQSNAKADAKKETITSLRTQLASAKREIKHLMKVINTEREDHKKEIFVVRGIVDD